MKLWILALVAWCAVAQAAPYVPPAPTRWVTDGVGFLSPAVRSELDTKLETYEQQTGHQVIVWIGAALPDNEPIDDFAARVFKAWGIGNKKLDDGVVMFVVPETHDLRIEVGYGLEDKIADLEAHAILTETVVPQIRGGHNDDAIQMGVSRIIADLGSDGTPKVAAPAQSGGLGVGWWILIIAGIVLLVILCIRYPNLAWFLFDVISSFSSSGGGSSGGSWGGGGGGGGGFSGGGGSSGGGGASAKW
ncbi:MAG: TPM domain-containing protein [Kofleriaceae bacterium]